MTDNHPINPPPELVQQWWKSTPVQIQATDPDPIQLIATQAAQWGADQELEVCVNWLADPCAADMPSLAKDLRYSRRPKAPSLKERIAAAITDGDYRTALSLLDEALPND